MTSISQNADYLCSQCFVQNFDYSFAIGAVAFSDRAVFNMFSRALAQIFDVSQEWFISHVCDSFFVMSYSEGRTDVTSARTSEQVGVSEAREAVTFGVRWQARF